MAGVLIRVERNATRDMHELARADFCRRTITASLLEALMRRDTFVEFLHEPKASAKQDEHNDRRQQSLFGTDIFLLRINGRRSEQRRIQRVLLRGQRAAGGAFAIRPITHCAVVRSAVTIG